VPRQRARFLRAAQGHAARGVSANVTRGGLAAAGLFDEAARAQRFELRLELAQLFLGRVLEVREDVSRRFLRADQLVELELIALPSRFCVAWMRKTIRKVMMVVPVLITSCQLSEKPNTVR